MNIRQGRKNLHNLYLIVGNEPSDDDLSIGYIRQPALAEEICRLVNAQPGGVVRKQSFVTDASWERSEELRPDRLGPTDADVKEVKDPERPSTSLH